MREENTVAYWKKKHASKSRLALFGTLAASIVGCIYADFLSSKTEMETIKALKEVSTPNVRQHTFDANNTSIADTVEWIVPAKFLKQLER